MKIGIPKEIKILEGRVALIPEAAGELVKHGHAVAIEQHAGELSGYSDEDYLQKINDFGDANLENGQQCYLRTFL